MQINRTNYKIFLWFLPILSAIFLLLSFPPLNWTILSFLSFLPLFFFLNLKNVSLKKSFLAGFLTGFIFWGGVIFFFFDVLPLSWVGINNNLLGFFSLLLVWFLSSSVLAVFVGLFSLGCHFFGRRKFWNLLFIPSLWVILEFLRAWTISIFLAGKETLLGPHWTYGNLGYVGAQCQSLRFLSSIGGMYFVSFLIVFVNVLFFFLFKNLILEKKNRKIGFLFTLLILFFISIVSIVSFPTTENKEKQTLKVAILQTKIPSSFPTTQETTEKKFQVRNQLFEKALQIDPLPDIIVFPEDSDFLKQLSLRGGSSEFPSQKEIFIIDSHSINTLEERKLSAVFFSTQRGSLAHYEELFLAPFGEYLPYIIEVPAVVINENWVKRFDRTRTYRRGKEVVIFSSPEGWQGSTLFCSEILSPDLHRQATEKGAQVLFSLGSFGFSSGSRLLNSQIEAVLQLRAAENGRYLVRATNYGSSYIIDNGGEIIKKSPNFENQILPGEINLFSRKTFYTQYGDWILILAGLILLTSCIFVLKYKKQADL